MESIATLLVARMTAKDFPFAVYLSNTMNWNATTQDFEFALALEPEGCYVIMDGSEHAGIVTTVCYGKVGWIGNLIVAEEYRNRGAGSLLTKHAVEHLRRRNVDTVGLYAYTQLTGFYEHFGFKKDQVFSVLKGKPTSLKATKPIARIKEKDVPSIINFDSKCFGADRSKLLSPILHAKRNLCYAFKEDSAIKGYVASNIYGKIATIGPLICVKNDLVLARSLLETILSKLSGFEVFICIPRNEKDLLRLLFSTGFQEEFQVFRMFSGSRLPPKCIYIPESLERG